MRPSKSFKLPFNANKFVWSKTQPYIFLASSNKVIYSLDLSGKFDDTGLIGDGLIAGPHDELIVTSEKLIFAYNQVSKTRYQDIELADNLTHVDFGHAPFTAVVWDESGGSSTVDFDSGTQLFRVDEFVRDLEPAHDHEAGSATLEDWNFEPNIVQESELIDLNRWAGVRETETLRQVRLTEGSIHIKTSSHEFRVESPSGAEFTHYDYAETGRFGIIAAEDTAGGIHMFNASAPSESFQLMDGSNLRRTALIGFDYEAEKLAIYAWSASGETIQIWAVRRLEARISQNLSTYRNAKVVLAGDTGVGKSGLFLRLTGQPYEPTESTHSRSVARFGPTDEAAEETREIFLWDLAGQPGYRIMHQLSLRDVSVGLVVFDSREESTSLRSLSFWGQSLMASSSALKPPKIVLVSARSDRGVPSLSHDDITTLNTKFPIENIHNTSAKEGIGVEKLRKEILGLIAWEECQAVIAPQSFFEIRDRLLEYKSTARLSFVAEEDLISAVGDNDSEVFRAVIRLSLKRLEAAGALVKLVQRDLWLLEPELLDSIVSSMAIAARNDPDGLGRVKIDDLVDGRLLHDQLANPIDEQMLVASAVVEVVARRLACRVDTDEGPVLVFPTAQRLGMETEIEPSNFYCSISFSGPVSLIYSAATIRLMATEEFGTGFRLYKSSVQFPIDDDEKCGYALELREDDTAGILKCFFSEGVRPRSRNRFLAMLRKQVELLSNGHSSTLERLYFHCGIEISDLVIANAKNQDRSVVFCNMCGTQVNLVAVETTRTDMAWVDSADRKHDRDQRREIRLLKRDANAMQRLFQTFVCYNTVDRPVAINLYDDLFKAGIVPWMDVKSDLSVSNAVKKIDQLVSTVPSALICLGPSSVGKFQEHEYHSFLHRVIYDEDSSSGSKFRLAVVLLPGASASSVPALLKPIERFDLSTRRNSLDEVNRLAEFVDSSL